MKLAICASVIAMLSGCAHYEQQKRDEQSRTDLKAVTVVCSTASADHVFDPIRSQIPANPMRATVAQLSDPTYIRPEQKHAVDQMQPILSACRDRQKQWMSQYHGEQMAVIYDQMLQAEKLNDADLWVGKITFGQYNTAQEKLVNAARQSGSNLEQQQALQAQQLEMQRQRNAAMMLPYLMPRAPVTTNCYGYGSSLSCTTR